MKKSIPTRWERESEAIIPKNTWEREQEKHNLTIENKTISDGGITVDFSIIKVHTSN